MKENYENYDEFKTDLNKLPNKIIEYENFWIIVPNQKEVNSKENSKSKEKTCLACGVKFKYGRINITKCYLCKIYGRCKNCSLIFKFATYPHKIYDIKQEGIFNGCCSNKCHMEFINKAKTARIGKPGYCTGTSCKHKGELVTIVDNAGMCKDCNRSAAINASIATTKITPKWGRCGSKNCDRKNVIRKLQGWGLCRKCAYNTALKSGKINVKRNPIFQSNFHTQDDCLFYKGIEIKELISRIESGLTEIPKDWKKIDGVWYFKEINLLSIKHIERSIKKNFIKSNNKTLVYNRTTKEYVSWNEFKIKAEKGSYLYETNIYKKVLALYPQTKIIPTFITNVDNKPGHRSMEGLGVFQRYIEENNIGWNAYGKFAKDENGKIIPIVGDKSGSNLVLIKGHDLDFRSDKPEASSLYLKKNNCILITDYILIIPTETESEACQAEKDLFKLGFPFGS